MGYIFEWTNTEVFGYIASQYLWRNSRRSGDQQRQPDRLPLLRLSRLLRRQGGRDGRPRHGRGLGRERPDDAGRGLRGAVSRDRRAAAPGLSAPGRDRRPRRWRWREKPTRPTPARSRTSGIPATSRRTSAGTASTRLADKLFKTERLRLLYVSTRRSQKICEAVLAHRMSQRLIAEGAPAGEVLKYLDKAVEAARREPAHLLHQLRRRLRLDRRPVFASGGRARAHAQAVHRVDQHATRRWCRRGHSISPAICEGWTQT